MPKRSHICLQNRCCNSNSAEYERNRRFRQLAYALGWLANEYEKLPSVGLCLNATKSGFVLERNDSSSGHTLMKEKRGTLCVTKCCRATSRSKYTNLRAKSFADDFDKEWGIASSGVDLRYDLLRLITCSKDKHTPPLQWRRMFFFRTRDKSQ